MILDTNALSATADREPAALRVLSTITRLAVSVITLGEYRHGIARSRFSDAYRNWLEDFLLDCLVLDVTNESSVHYATIHLELKRIGRPIPTNDIWIAALCRQHNFPLLSRDRHFDVVSGVQRVEW